MNAVFANSKASDHTAHTRSLIRTFASHLIILIIVKLLTGHHLEFLSLKGGCTGSSESIHVKTPHCWKSYIAAQLCRSWFEHDLIANPLDRFSRRHGPV